MKNREYRPFDEKMLKEAVVRFQSDRNKQNFIEVLDILRDSYVVVPCSAVFSDRDTSSVEKMLKEHNWDPEQLTDVIFTTKDEVRLIPDILQNGTDFFFPIFSSAEEMGEYGDNFSKIEKHIADVIPLARNNEKCVKGIVLNAFTDPFVLDVKLFDLVENVNLMRGMR